MKQCILFILIAGLLTSCEKNIDFIPPNQAQLLVVDGNIETGKYPQVVLSTSINFLSTIGWNQLENSYVHDADITISDSTSTQPLIEYTIPLGAGFNAYYYSVDTTKVNAMRGIVGKTYTINIKYNNQTYTSTSTIPFPRLRLDSIWYENIAVKEDSDKVNIRGKFIDQKGFGDNFRYFTKRNTKGSFLPGRNSVGNDQVIDGTTFITKISQGVDRISDTTDTNKGQFMKGDTITIKFCNVDKGVYTFWNTWEFSYNSTGNPFSSPGVVLNNVSNGALGAFCAYNPQYKTLIVPKK